MFGIFFGDFILEIFSSSPYGLVSKAETEPIWIFANLEV